MSISKIFYPKFLPERLLKNEYLHAITKFNLLTTIRPIEKNYSVTNLMYLHMMQKVLLLLSIEYISLISFEISISLDQH